MPSHQDRTLRIGISTVLRGRLADPEAVRALALAAEQLGDPSLWVTDAPLSAEDRPATVAPAGEDGLDPLTALANTAAVTTRVRLGTRVAVGPGQGTAGLERALRSVDRLSDGRLTVAVGLPGARGPALGLTLLDRLGDGPRPAVLVVGADPLADADAEAAGKALAGRVDGWLATGIRLDTLADRWPLVRSALGGPDPDLPVRLLVHAPLALGPALGPGRPAFGGDLGQIVADVAAAGRAGAGEVVLGLSGDPGLDEALDTYARVAEAVEDVH